MDRPAAEAIRSARQAAGHTQTVAAATVHVALRSWQEWEAGTARIPGAAWDLYLLMTDQHPQFAVTARNDAR